MLEKYICPYFCLTIRDCLVSITYPVPKTSVFLMLGYLGLMFCHIFPLSLYSSTYLSILLIARETPASHQPSPEDNWEPPDTSVTCSLFCFWSWNGNLLCYHLDKICYGPAKLVKVRSALFLFGFSFLKIILNSKQVKQIGNHLFITSETGNTVTDVHRRNKWRNKRKAMFNLLH